MILISHRGVSTIYPENTFIAFQKSFEAGFEFIELDIALTKDQEIVVIHDDTIDRTSNGFGLVKNMTLQELKSYDFGIWKDKRYEFQKIPTLQEIFFQFQNQFKINVEIKFNIFDENHTQIADLLYEMITKHQIGNDVLISSFQLDVLKYLSKLDSKLHLSYLVYKESQQELEKIISETKFVSLNIAKERADETWVQFAHQNNLMLFVYTVNDKENYQKFKNMNVDGIFTDQTKIFFKSD